MKQAIWKIVSVNSTDEIYYALPESNFRLTPNVLAELIKLHHSRHGHIPEFPFLSVSFFGYTYSEA